MLVYLDSSIIIAWMQGREQSDDIIFYNGVSDIMRRISKPTRPKQKTKKGVIYVIASDVLIDEVWPKHHKHIRGYGEFEKKLSDFTVVSPDDRIMRKAAEIQNQLGFENADAIHVATAICWQSDYLFTKDNDMLRHVEVISEMTKGKTKIAKPPIPGTQLSLPNSLHP